MEAWFADAQSIPDLDMEICFLLNNPFEEAADIFPTEESNRNKSERRHLPAIPRKEDRMLRTAEAVDYVNQLAEHYREIVKTARSRRQPFNAIRHCFWLRFWLWSTEHAVYVSFPWYDTYSEINHFLTKLSSGSEGQLFWDRDQCWEQEVYAELEHFFIRERDPDYQETRCLIKVPRESLLSQIQPLRERTEVIINSLTAAIGRDVWTSYSEWLDFLPPEPPMKKNWWHIWKR